MDRQVVAAAASGGAVLALFTDRLIRALIARRGKAGRKPRPVNGATKQPISGSGAGPEPGLWRATPHPDWSPGQKLPPPYPAADDVHSVDPSVTPSDVMYPLIISSVVPRPIAFVSTLSAQGVGNLAPYSYFNVLAHNPPHVAIGFCATGLREHGKKDSLVNILETGEFVVNIISEWFVEAANHCCGTFDYGDNEMALAGLTPVQSLRVAPPRVAESAVQMECRVAHTYEVKNAAGAVTTTIVLGEVVMMHVAEGVAGRSPSGKLIVDVNKLKPVSRLGGNTYGRSEGLFDLPRPDRST